MIECPIEIQVIPLGKDMARVIVMLNNTSLDIFYTYLEGYKEMLIMYLIHVILVVGVFLCIVNGRNKNNYKV